MNVSKSLASNLATSVSGELKQAKAQVGASDGATASSLDWSGGYKSHLEFAEKRDIAHRTAPMNQAGSALKTIGEQLAKLQKVIGDVRPDLAKADWDFTVQDGELRVTGELSDSDKQWLEGVLNGSDELRAAAKSFVNAAVAYLETNEENPVYKGRNAFTGKIDMFDFKDVEKQFAKAFRFRSAMRDVTEMHRDLGTGQVYNSMDAFGGDSLALLASRLKPQSVLV